MRLFRNILFPTDFTQHARSALKYAAAFARAGNGRVVLFSVQTGRVPPNLLTLPERLLQEQENHWLLQLQREVRELLSDPLLHGLEVEPVIVAGEPATEIAKAVRDYDIDLVTVVTHGRRGLARALFGSTAEEIIAEAPCPVLTIRPPQHDFVHHRGDRTEVRLNRVLLATNFRASSLSAMKTARDIAEANDAELHAVHVIGDYFEQISLLFPEEGGLALSRMRKEVTERMESFARERGARVKVHAAEGRPYAEIVSLAAKIDADLIVIGTSIHASLFGGAPVLGSETERVVRNAPCPVLCVPSGKVVTPLPSFSRAQAVPQT
ncbi:MAG TPA: universal stress protein [Pyrinomonadaceae bacterium]|jgi:nucleotide-binding universal stress UspA family protein|nr:universal stress protein [Pyrinomonadaceae bacterium]